MDSLVYLPMKIILIKAQQSSAEARADGCNAEVAETVTCVGVTCSDFTQHTKYSLFLRDRHNFLFFIMEKAI